MIIKKIDFGIILYNNEDINKIIRIFYRESYNKKFFSDNISNCGSYNSDKQKSYLDRIIGDYKNEYPELKDESIKISDYFNK